MSYLDHLLSNDCPVPFGKYRGMPINDLVRNDPSYAEWMISAYNSGKFDHPWIGDNLDTLRNALISHAQDMASEAAAALTLTPHQAEVAAALTSSILQGEPVVFLSGGAGYGKSYVTAQLAANLIDVGYTVRATAVSYVATQVLAQQLAPFGVECSTLARTLRFKKDFEEGQEVYSLSDDSPDYAREALEEGNVLLVDECSMISDDIAKFLFDAVHQHGGRLVLVGDAAQLPPVKQETLSIACTAPQVVQTLRVPMRYSTDSALYAVEQMARSNPQGLIMSMRSGAFNGSTEVAMVADPVALVDAFVDNYRADPKALHRMLLFRRAEVVNANNSIRARLFGNDAPLVVEDERLMVLSTTDYPFGASRDLSTRFYSGQAFSVVKARECSGADAYRIDINGTEFRIPHYAVRFSGAQTSAAVRVVFSVTENTTDQEKLGGPEFQAALSAALAYGRQVDELGNSTGSWDAYKKLLGDFVRVAYQYATSVHRAQGQTCDYAYCSPWQLIGVKGITGRALAYVAQTRARKKLTVLI